MAWDGDAARRALRALLDLAARALDGDLRAALETVVHETAGALRVRAVALHLHRPAWDDFEVVAVHAPPEEAAALLGRTVPRSTLDALLDPRFDVGGARFIPEGAIDDDVLDGPSVVFDRPDRPDHPDRWRPHDELVVPIHDTDGAVIGFLAVDEPESGMRPGPDELSVLVDLTDAIAVAVRTANAAVAAARNRRALEQLFELSAGLTGAEPVDELLGRCCEGVRDALGFERVAIELAEPDHPTLSRRAAVGWNHAGPPGTSQLTELQALCDPDYEIEGCYLLPLEAALARVGPTARRYRSRTNGRGPRAWNQHWLLVPLADPNAGADAGSRWMGWLWVDDPVDRLLPTREQLRTLRVFANQAAMAISAATHVAKLRELARHDDLTGVLNRGALFAHLAEELARTERTGQPVTLVLCDLDDFKSINDRHGHPVGDAALIEFAQLLVDSVRSVDAVGRVGGDEFALVLAGDPDPATVMGRIEEHLAGRGDDERVSGVSWGAASAPTDGTTPEELNAAADVRLYADKRRGSSS